MRLPEGRTPARSAAWRPTPPARLRTKTAYQVVYALHVFHPEPKKNQAALTPGVLVLANSGGIPRTPPRDRGIPATRAAAVGPNPLRRPIRSLRLRLDRIPIRSRPSDPNPMAEIQRQQFALALFLKRPPTLPKSTCGPALVKSIYGLVLFLAHNPLAFLEIEPAILCC